MLTYGQSGYFEGWEGQTRDSYCPQIASPSNSPAKSKHDSAEPELLPTACSRPRRPGSIRRDAQIEPSERLTSKTRRYGIVPYASTSPGKAATAQLDHLLNDAMSNTEDILSAMYDPGWDVNSLQQWYRSTPQGPADLALFKIMFSLRYTLDEPSPVA